MIDVTTEGKKLRAWYLARLRKTALAHELACSATPRTLVNADDHHLKALIEAEQSPDSDLDARSSTTEDLVLISAGTCLALIIALYFSAGGRLDLMLKQFVSLFTFVLHGDITLLSGAPSIFLALPVLLGLTLAVVIVYLCQRKVSSRLTAL
jgi:hypothetical protein